MTERKVDIDLEAIRARAESATPGPWWWAGERSTQRISINARSPIGACEVLTFWRWGMQNAKPVFSDNAKCLLLPDTEDRLIYQVCPDATSHEDPRVYRQTISGVRHPDAEFMVHSRQDVDDLLAHIDALEAQLQELREVSLA